jgi:hypothetical protein
MVSEYFNISIIDTFENDRPLILERTQIQSPRLLYNGQEDKFGNLFTSELSFNILVTTNNAAHFLHLFTGSETRYRVNLETLNNNVSSMVWEGYLLPELFNEPLKNKDFFVEFVATDGIGLLKGKELSASFYKDKKSSIDVLHSCLALTGLSQSIIYAEALQNAGFTLDYQDLCVQTIAYADDENTSVYDIINYIIDSLGCKLFTYKGDWYLIGLNRFSELTIAATKYPVNTDEGVIQPGVSYTITRDILEQPYFATPNITALPKLKEAVVTWSHNSSEFIFPEDVVTHYPVDFETNTNDRTVRYWDIVTNTNISLAVWLKGLQFRVIINEDELVRDAKYFGIIKYFKEKEEKFNGPFLSFSDSITSVSALDTNYAKLSTPFYVNGSANLNKTASLKIEFFIIAKEEATSEELEAAYDNNEFNNHFFKIIRSNYKEDALSDSELVLSNFVTGGVPDDAFSFDVSIGSRDILGIGKVSVITGKLDIPKILLVQDGYYNLIIYPTVSNALLTDEKVYDKLEFTMSEDATVTTTVERGVDFTTKQEVDIFHNGDESNRSPQRFVFSDSLTSALDSGTVPSVAALTATRFYSKEAVYVNGFINYYIITLGLYDVDYYKIRNGYNVYMKKPDGTITLVPESLYVIEENVAAGGKILRQVDYVPEQPLAYFQEVDELHLVYTLNYANNWLNKWRRYGVDESVSYDLALARMYLDIQKNMSYVFNGDYALLVGPLDIIRYNYGVSLDKIPTKIEMSLDKNRSSVTAIQLQQGFINYLDTTDILNIDPVVPIAAGIVIDSKVISPGLFNASWYLNTRYSVNGINPVNATLRAFQLTDSPGNGGVPTGLVRSAVILDYEGLSSLEFSVPLGVNQGWYKVYAEQGLTVSNFEYVEVGVVSSPSSASISIMKHDTDLITETQGAYTVDFINFTPTGVVQQVVQEIDPITYENTGSPSVIVITNLLAAQTFTVSGPGSYKLTVVAVGYSPVIESNEIGWFF